jgi:NAD(P)-dependent dehydrogenase (short-subunit alcohol dehydrogenase family)
MNASLSVPKRVAAGKINYTAPPRWLTFRWTIACHARAGRQHRVRYAGLPCIQQLKAHHDAVLPQICSIKENVMKSQDKVAVITGASQGIGAGLVKGFLGRGYRVVANSRKIHPSTADTPQVVTVAGDIADPQTADRVVATAIERFGRIDTLVNNAGIFISKPFVDYSVEDFATVLAVNLAGFFHISQRVAKQMLQQGNGHIVQITTTMAEQPLQSVPAAMASLTKGGLNAVTRALAIEYAGRGIRVNAVAPGIINTPMHTPESHDFLARLHPLGRLGEVREIVEAVLYLESADFVTGEVLHVDGGQHAGH